MTEDEKMLVEGDLCNAIRAFHDLDDKKKRNAYSREYFWEFCQKYHLDPQEAFQILEKILKEKSKIGFSNYSDSVTVLKRDIKKHEDNSDSDGR